MPSHGPADGPVLEITEKGGQSAVPRINNVNMNGDHPVVLECEYRGNVYHSRYLYSNIPEPGSEVTLYVDRMDDRIGYVDC